MRKGRAGAMVEALRVQFLQLVEALMAIICLTVYDLTLRIAFMFFGVADRVLTPNFHAKLLLGSYLIPVCILPTHELDRNLEGSVRAATRVLESPAAPRAPSMSRPPAASFNQVLWEPLDSGHK